MRIPSSPLFGCKELAGAGEVAVGSDQQFITICKGAWTFFFPIDREGRYPRAEQAIPSLTAGVTRCRISAEDAKVLAQRLVQIPGVDEEHAPVTLDLNGQVLVRGRAAEKAQVTEVVLTHSEVKGKPVQVNINRRLLARMLVLGFHELFVGKADAPVVCRDCDGPLSSCRWVGRGRSGRAKIRAHQFRKQKDVAHEQSVSTETFAAAGIAP